MKRALLSIVSILLSVSILIPLGWGTGEEPTPFIKVGQIGPVQYVSGGVGIEEREAMKAFQKDYNLKLVFALRTGEYLSNVKVVIKDEEGRALLSADSNGPWFMARLPEGLYTLEVSFGDSKFTKQVSVGRGLRTILFHWKE